MSKDLYTALARLLDYPGPDFMNDIARCLASNPGDVYLLLEAFRVRVQDFGISRLQEIYVETFDFHAETSPYIGHHLFGEEIRRSLFMAELRGRYRECGVVENSEVPDHLASILRFLGAGQSGEERSELIQACLIPAIQHVMCALQSDNPYSTLLQAILLKSRQETSAETAHGEIAWIPFSSSSSPTSR